MIRHSLASLTTILLLLASSHASAAIYKWKNEQGQVSYGSVPPQGVPAQKMGINTKFTPPPAPKATKASPKKTPENKTKDKPEDPYSKEQHATLCTNAKKDIADLNKGGRLRVKQKDGSTVVMDEKTKATRMKTMQDMMKKHCK